MQNELPVADTGQPAIVADYLSDFQELHRHELAEGRRQTSKRLLIAGAIIFTAEMIAYGISGLPNTYLIWPFGFAVLYGGLALLARRQPLVAIWAGIGIYVLVLGLAAFADPSVLYQGLLMKLALFYVFSKGFYAARQAENARRELSR